MVECSGCPPSSLWTSDMFLTMLKLLWFWSFLEPLKGCGESLVEGPWNWARQMDWGLKNHSVSCLSDQIYFSKESKKILNTHNHAKSDKAIGLHFECPWTVAVSKSWFVRFNPANRMLQHLHRVAWNWWVMLHKTQFVGSQQVLFLPALLELESGLFNSNRSDKLTIALWWLKS